MNQGEFVKKNMAFYISKQKFQRKKILFYIFFQKLLYNPNFQYCECGLKYVFKILYNVELYVL